MVWVVLVGVGGTVWLSISTVRVTGMPVAEGRGGMLGFLGVCYTWDGREETSGIGDYVAE